MNQREREIRERAEKATPGPWEWQIADDAGSYISLSEKEKPFMESLILGCERCRACREHVKLEELEAREAEGRHGRCDWPKLADSDFIKHSRADVPYLLDALSTVRGLLKEAMRFLDIGATGDDDLDVWRKIRAELKDCEPDDKEEPCTHLRT